MKIDHSFLKNYLINIFEAYGTSKNNAELVSRYLIESDLVGHSSHGVARAPLYLERIKKGDLIPNANLEIINETENTAIINGNWGFGQPAAKLAIETCIDKAKKENLGLVTLKNANHIGRLADYTSRASDQGFISIATANLHGTSHVVAPHGGIDRKLPTNPISIAIPGQNQDEPFILDMSSCAISEGKLKIKYNNNELINDGLIINNKGKSSNDTKEFYEDPKGSILPLGGVSSHKGFGLSLAIDILSGGLSGGGSSCNKYSHHGNAAMFIVIKISPFVTRKEFTENLEDLTNHVKSSRLLDGYNKIYFPGEIERETKIINSKNGITIDRVTIEHLNRLAEEKKINIKI